MGCHPHCPLAFPCCSVVCNWARCPQRIASVWQPRAVGARVQPQIPSKSVSLVSTLLFSLLFMNFATLSGLGLARWT